MTPNERKILKCLWDAKGRAHVRVVSENIGITADYTRLLCCSLARAGYLKFADASICYLLTRGRNRFRDSNPIIETAEPDAIVNPEIVIETVSASVSEKDETASEDESRNVDLDNDEEEITDSDSDEKLVEEIQNEILEEETRIGELVSEQGQDIEEKKQETHFSIKNIFRKIICH